jgi:hypothetical protein
MRTKKNTALIVFAVLALGGATAAARFQVQSQKIPEGPVQEQATVIEEGQMTEKQRQHSKLFKRYESATGGRKLRELVAEKGDVGIVRDIGDVLVPASFNIQDYLSELTCAADAVVLGNVQAKSSQLIEEGTFVFTDYQISVEEVLKSRALPINKNATITVTRVGGVIALNGHTVRAVDHRQEPLSVGGRYLLYLRLIPTTGSFRAFADSASEDTFQVIGRKIVQTSEKALPLGRRHTTDVDNFMTQVKLAVQTPCKSVAGTSSRN